MYYRRKILLSLLQVFDGQLEKISFQKLLFLLARQQEEPSFHFVPYKFGCFSFQANSDLHTLNKYGLITEHENNWKKIDSSDYFSVLKTKDKAAIRSVKNLYGNLNKDELVKLIYKNYPYFAINSTIALNILNTEELQKIDLQRPSKDNTVLYTIGYERASLEQYLNKLIINGIKALCDVRKNPLSMKYGFSKNQLEKSCNGVGIKYIHIPEVGIESNKRKHLKTQADYDELFAFYKKQILTRELFKQQEILELLQKYKRIALTCFEANFCQCHRKHLAESIASLDGFSYEIKHI